MFQTKLATEIIDRKISMAEVVDTMWESMSMDDERSGQFKLNFLNEEENRQINTGLRRIKEVGDVALSTGNIRLLVDGEYTYMNPGISAVTLAMMMAFNQKKAVVCHTYQCYLKVLQGFRTMHAITFNKE